MKIWGDIQKVSGVYNKHSRVNRTEKPVSVNGKKDTVSISGEAKDFQTVMRALKDVPDVRRDKVDALAEKYRSGSYTVSGKETADKIIKSVLDKRI
ncbi:MAG TPA: flagellar biosynthesis anti-sigma factor FlgM [Clostridiaceae bacterium]|nr:flagellar biosynthesis anti-sigma factor FlgM [Clostridiaceae bacterium]